MCHHLSFRHHCEIHIRLAAGLGRRGGCLVKGAYLSAWASDIKRCDGRLTQLLACCSTGALVLLTADSHSLLFGRHGSCIQRWRVSELWTFLCLLHGVVFSFWNRKMWTKSSTDFFLLYNSSGVRAAGRRKKKGESRSVVSDFMEFSINGRSTELNSSFWGAKLLIQCNPWLSLIL